MNTTDLIPIQIICNRYNVPVSFINTLEEFQLIEIIVQKNDGYIHTKQIKKLEKMMRMHYDLDINFEGIDVIRHLLKQNETLQNEITRLHNRLKFYEDL